MQVFRIPRDSQVEQNKAQHDERVMIPGRINARPVSVQLEQQRTGLATEMSPLQAVPNHEGGERRDRDADMGGDQMLLRPIDVERFRKRNADDYGDYRDQNDQAAELDPRWRRKRKLVVGRLVILHAAILGRVQSEGNTNRYLTRGCARMQEFEEAERVATRGRRIASLSALILFYASFDFFLTLLYWMAGRQETLPLHGAYVGLFVAQIDLIGFWTALGPGRMIVRAPWALLAITLTYVIQQSGADRFNGYPISPEDKMLLAAILLFWWLVSAGSLLGYRLVSRRQLLRSDQSPASSRKFHVRHLIFGTTLCGVTLAVLNGFGYPISGVFDVDWQQQFALGAVAFVNLPIAIPAIIITFRTERAVSGWQLGLAGYCAAVTVVQMTVMRLAMGMPPDFMQAFLFLLTLNGAQCLSLMFSLYLIRGCGYDLQIVDSVRREATPENGAAAATVAADPWSDDE